MNDGKMKVAECVLEIFKLISVDPVPLNVAGNCYVRSGPGYTLFLPRTARENRVQKQEGKKRQNRGQ